MKLIRPKRLLYSLLSNYIAHALYTLPPSRFFFIIPLLPLTKVASARTELKCWRVSQASGGCSGSGCCCSPPSIFDVSSLLKDIRIEGGRERVYYSLIQALPLSLSHSPLTTPTKSMLLCAPGSLLNFVNANKMRQV